MARNQKDQKTIHERLLLYLDNELSKDAQKQLQIEIEENPGYQDFLNSERVFLEFIRNKIPRKKASPALLKTLKETINFNANGSKQT